MSKLAQFLQSTVVVANSANPANLENEKSHAPRANPANPANPDDASGKISNFSNISSGVSEKSFSLSDFDAQAEESQAVALSPAQEAARREVLAQLEKHPTIKRAFVNRFEPDGTMVVTLAIRGVGTGELKIPADRFNQDTLDDYGALLNTIEGAP